MTNIRQRHRRRRRRNRKPIVPQSVFKSLVSKIKKATDIYMWIANALLYQECFEKKTSPWEKQRWNDEQLEAFRIEPERIDRVYAINCFEEYDEYGRREYDMVARQKYKNGHIFIQLIGLTCDDDFSCSYCTEKAVIYISEDPNYFMNLLSRGEFYHRIPLIQESLAEDGVEIKPPNRYHLDTIHPDVFKSLDPRITTVTDIDRLMGHVLQSQHLFEKRTTSWEQLRWDKETLEAFRIDSVCIDRVYFIDYFNDAGFDYYFLIARQKHENGYIFVELDGKRDFDGYSDDRVIYISDDLYCFMDLLMQKKRYPMDLIHQSLAEDGIVLCNISPPVLKKKCKNQDFK